MVPNDSKRADNAQYHRRRPMTKGRLEAFSDGVIAILITIMVLELHVPHGADLQALWPLCPVFLAYLLSFVFLGIYWNNHHHMLHAAERINGRILWWNHALLFWLSLVPFATAWMGHNRSEPLPTAAYGLVLLLAGQTYMFLAGALYAEHGPQSRFARALAGGNIKGLVSRLLYVSAIGLAWVRPWIAQVLYFAVACMWFIPERRVEQILAEERG
jgi:uncharacterized membrane protein